MLWPFSSHHNSFTSFLTPNPCPDFSLCLSALPSSAWRRKWQPAPVFLPGKSHGQKSLVSLSPWGRKVRDTTEWLTLHLHSSCSSFKILITTSHPKGGHPFDLWLYPHPLHELGALLGSRSSTLSLHLLLHLAHPTISNLSPILSLTFLLTNLEELL